MSQHVHCNAKQLFGVLFDSGNDGEGSAEEQFANLLSRSDQLFEPRKPLNPANNPDAPDVNPERLLDARPDGKAVGT